MLTPISAAEHRARAGRRGQGGQRDQDRREVVDRVRQQAADRRDREQVGEARPRQHVAHGRLEAPSLAAPTITPSASTKSRKAGSAERTIAPARPIARASAGSVIATAPAAAIQTGAMPATELSPNPGA